MFSRSLVPGRLFAPTLRDNADPFQALHREVNRLFDDFWPSDANGRNSAPTLLSPSIDVHEDDKSLTVSVEVPGVEEKDVDVSVDENVLVVRGEKKSAREDKSGDYHVAERSYGHFERRLRLPDYVDADKADAAYRNGVLTVTFPKQPEEARSRKISIKAT